MRLSSMADYAVVTMTAAARHCGGARVSAAQLADETGLPAPTVQKLVSRLTAAGLLRSSRGAGGGLKLARPAAAITLSTSSAFRPSISGRYWRISLSGASVSDLKKLTPPP